MKADLKHAYPAGLENVYLLNGFDRVDTPFGSGFGYRDVPNLERAVCHAVIFKPGRLNAEEIAFLRLKADWRQEDVAERLHVTAQTVSLWERGQVRISAAADLLFRMRFATDCPKRWRPSCKVQVLWNRFDAAVTTIREFTYVGTWADGWSFLYELRGTNFVARSEDQFEYESQGRIHVGNRVGSIVAKIRGKGFAMMQSPESAQMAIETRIEPAEYCPTVRRVRVSSGGVLTAHLSVEPPKREFIRQDFALRTRH